jgi:hypothetical protein
MHWRRVVHRRSRVPELTVLLIFRDEDIIVVVDGVGLR